MFNKGPSNYPPPLPYVHGVILPPPGTFGCAQKVPRCHQNCSKRLFFGPNFCLRSKFERIFKKYPIFFGLRVDFRKKKSVQKKGQKRVKIGVLGFLPYFTLFYPILPYFTLFYPIFPYFGPDLGLRRLNLGLRAKPRGLKAARRWDGD